LSALEQLQATHEQVLQRLREDERFVLAAHESPDGDALGSLVAMQGLLNALGKDSAMFISPHDLPLPREYRFFTLEGLIQHPPADIAQRTVVFLDCGNIDRNSASVLRDGAHLLNIDHHHDNTRFGTLNYVVPDASCTAEIVWGLMHGLGVRPTASIAEALYVALITDTGRFMYENTGARAHLMAAELIEAGVDVPGVYRRLYEGVPSGKLALLALALSQLQRFDGGELTLASLSTEDFERADAQESYSEGIIDQMRALEGTKVAVLVRELSSGERKGQRKVSLRATDDDVDVSIVARAQGGGGHRRAAGFSTTLEPRELVAFLRAAIAAQLHPSSDGHAAATRAAAATTGARAVDGVLLIDKPAGISSHDAVAAVRRSLAGARTGHAGTLDPFATGLLLVLVGRATKAQRALMALPKRYETVAQLGARSSTGDTEGEIARTGRVPPDPPALPTGEVRQRPPIYSAVKIAGERAYKRARRGESVEMPERIVTVHRFEQRWRDPHAPPGLPAAGELPRAGFLIECGSGTYVRSLIAELGDAYCLELRRTAIGPFDVSDACAPPSRGERWREPPLIALERALELAARHAAAGRRQ
jgi:bifunctional oligoribonuclease and PAP phosphatase NrnA